MAIILLADDEKSIRTILGALLKDAGHEVIEAADADEAIRCVERYPLDVALLDILLGTGNGLDVARHIHDWRPVCRSFAKRSAKPSPANCTMSSGRN